MREYEPLFHRRDEAGEDLDRVRDLFAAASEAYLSFPWSWMVWALLLPAAALATTEVALRWGWAGGLALWSLTILAGGAVELLGIRRGQRRARSSPLAGWVLNVQGNLSLVALLLSLALIAVGATAALPGLWLLLLGHSFYAQGGLAFPPFRGYGLWLQLGGAVALWPRGVDPLVVFAAVTFAGNLWIGWSLWRARGE
ncbi:MAG TPA: hypothetical protein VMT16_14775 [Thermoanaerobaculia bacterium]|nr:hypothetical protein [Thermoanaerobaculia bacterium]